MKRFASNFLYISPDIVYKKYVVEIEGNRVKCFYPLIKEIESTSWLSGSIVISDKSFYNIKNETTFQEVLLSLTFDKSANEEKEVPELKYAYYFPLLQLEERLSDFSFSPELLTESFIL